MIAKGDRFRRTTIAGLACLGMAFLQSLIHEFHTLARARTTAETWRVEVFLVAGCLFLIPGATSKILLAAIDKGWIPRRGQVRDGDE